MKVLANDGIAESGKIALEKEGFTVVTAKVEQENLIDAINQEGYEVLLVRSATKVREDIIDACPGLKMIGRGGVGMDNIDVDYARSKGIEVFNTPAASSESVAELVMAHLFGTVRFLYDSNRQMPVKGASDFKTLKKAYAGGIEVRGKTIGIIGFGRIGKALAKYAIGCGMDVLICDRKVGSETLSLEIAGKQIDVEIQKVELEDLLPKVDFLSLHIPGGGEPVLGADEINSMKDGAILLNAARGGVVDEAALMAALDSGKLAHAALDVFVNEPNPSEAVLKHDKISLSPHIGAATAEAQDRIGTELAENIITYYSKVKA
ncbi:MAG: 3-phosphoglycerate dehydrogenase [Flavobacteriales bacterium]|nr:3-phosphoglycerate dehydrogenase [Flavobacteriales bacterium]